MDFFISPAYRVPPISTSFLPKLMTMNVLVRVPCRAGSAWKSGACRTVKSGRKCASSAGSARMNMFRTNERVPRVRRDEAHRQAVCRVGAAEEVLHEQLAASR